MNILLYLHSENIEKKNIELLNIAELWKNTTSSRLTLVIKKDLLSSSKALICSYNLDKVITLNFNDSSLEKIVATFKKLKEKENFDCIVMGNSIFEKELAPTIASIFNYDYYPNITNFKFNKKTSRFEKFLYGTKAIEKIPCNNKDMVITFSANIFKEKEYDIVLGDYSETIEFEDIDGKEIKEDNPPYEILNRKEKNLNTSALETAKIIVGVGKGIQDGKNMEIIYKLANLLGAPIGVTRSVVDNGWMEESLKIGQTGKIVKPELYLGFGISGAMQHMVGIRQARHVIMINNNPNAECFRESDLGVVADLFKIIPQIIELYNK